LTTSHTVFARNAVTRQSRKPWYIMVIFCHLGNYVAREDGVSVSTQAMPHGEDSACKEKTSGGSCGIFPHLSFIC